MEANLTALNRVQVTDYIVCGQSLVGSSGRAFQELKHRTGCRVSWPGTRYLRAVLLIET